MACNAGRGTLVLYTCRAKHGGKRPRYKRKKRSREYDYFFFAASSSAFYTPIDERDTAMDEQETYLGNPCLSLALMAREGALRAECTVGLE